MQGKSDNIRCFGEFGKELQSTNQSLAADKLEEKSRGDWDMENDKGVVAFDSGGCVVCAWATHDVFVEKYIGM
jgi:hypothetical protein